MVLIHGVAGRAAQWDQIVQLLADRHTVVAPDLLGHGESAKPRGDYSLGAHASGIRDLLVGLNIARATIVGHSLGGGIAMQFAYQFPERCERLVLVSSGGLGEEVHPMLRAATLPGSEFVLPVLAHPRLVGAAALVPRALGRIGLHTGPDLTEIARGYQSLSNAEARSAFIHTLRGVIDPTGQRVNASDRLYLASNMPTLIIWGAETGSSRSRTPSPPTTVCRAAVWSCSRRPVTSRSWTTRCGSRGRWRASSTRPSRLNWIPARCASWCSTATPRWPRSSSACSASIRPLPAEVGLHHR